MSSSAFTRALLALDVDGRQRVRATLDRLDREAQERMIQSPHCIEPRCPFPAIPLRHSPWPEPPWPQLRCQMHLDQLLMWSPVRVDQEGRKPCCRCGLKRPQKLSLCLYCIEEARAAWPRR